MLSNRPARASICKPFKGPGIDSKPGGPVRQPYLPYLPAKLHRNRFLGSFNVYKYGLRLHRLAEGIHSLESIPRLHKRLKIQVLSWFLFHGMVGIKRHSESLFLFFVARKGTPSCGLFRGMVRNGIPRIYIYFGSTERNSELCSLPEKGLEQNYGSLLLFLFHETEFRVIFSSAEGFGTEFRVFLFRGTTGIPSEITICSVYSVFQLDRRIHGIQLREHERPYGGVRVDSSSRVLDETISACGPETQGGENPVDERQSSVFCRSLQDDGNGDAGKLRLEGRFGALEDACNREADPDQSP